MSAILALKISIFLFHCVYCRYKIFMYRCVCVYCRRQPGRYKKMSFYNENSEFAAVSQMSLASTTTMSIIMYTNISNNHSLQSNCTTNSTHCPVHRGTGELILGSITFLVITIMTILGNALVILSVFTYRPLKKVQNYFIVSLAASDFTVASLVMPLHLVKFLLNGQWIFPLWLCQAWLTLDILCCTASILNLTAIAIDRYWAIRYAIEYANRRTTGLVIGMITCVW
jgi:hypothetical protein